MNHGDAFAGIGGFGLAAKRAGWKTVWACEIEPSARNVYAARLGHDGLRFDSDIRESVDLPPIDILTGGFPCQDISVAGRGAGLAGSRSGLFFELVRILESARPEWFCFENVDALLSINSGRDMGVVLSTLVECGYCVAWRVLNSRFFGLAQRRSRIFIVGHSTDWRRAASVLFEQAGRSRNSPRGKAGSRDPGTDFVGTLTAGGKRGYRIGAEDARDGHLVGACLARGAKGVGSTIDGQLVTHTLTSEGADASEDGTGRGTGIVVGTLTGSSIGTSERAKGAGIVSHALSTNGARVDRGCSGAEGVYVHPTLCGGNPYRGGSNAKTQAEASVTAPTLTTNSAKFGSGGRSGQPPTLVAGTVTSSGGRRSRAEDARSSLVTSISQNQRGEVRSSRIASALSSGGGGIPGQGYQLAQVDPDRVGEASGIPGPLDLCPQCLEGPDAPRYRGIGNAVSVPVIDWIFGRINEVRNQS